MLKKDSLVCVWQR